MLLAMSCRLPSQITLAGLKGPHLPSSRKAHLCQHSTFSPNCQELGKVTLERWVNTLAWYSFIDGVRRHEISGPEAKDNLLLIAIEVAWVLLFCHWFPESQFLQNDIKSRRHLHMLWVVLCERKPELREPIYFQMDKHGYALLWREIL